MYLFRDSLYVLMCQHFVPEITALTVWAFISGIFKITFYLLKDDLTIFHAYKKLREKIVF